MCGIIGYIGTRQAKPLLLEGLSKLEYRGYDSAGLCVFDGEKLQVLKERGRVGDLAAEPGLEAIRGNVGIAHTRWATHGEPSRANAHPHGDCSGTVAVVHNGIVENYHSLRTVLESEGHTFLSQTDSEVLAHLVEKFLPGRSLEQAVLQALNLVEGTYGIVAISSEERKLVAARRGSPLLIGIGEGETFLASDATAILPYASQVVYLQDGDVAVADESGYRVMNGAGEEREPVVEQLRMDVEQVEKQGYPHFMLKEIFEQPVAVANTIRGRLKDGRIKLSLGLEVARVQRVIMTACGTSWHSALIGKYLVEKLVGIPVEVDYASEFRYRDPLVSSADAVVVISQSGETADTLAALREATGRGAQTVGVINVVGSTIAREVGSGIYLHAGPEIGVASTKAFTCQVTALLLFALWLRQERGGEVPQQLLGEIGRLPELLEQTLRCAPEVEAIAPRYVDSAHMLYLGRGLNFPVALEGALKLKEISYIHAEGYPAAEMKHGPIALVDRDMPVVFIAPHDRTYEKIVSNVQEIRARQGRVLAIVTEPDPAMDELAERTVLVPAVAEELMPLLTVVPLQLLAYYVAVGKGLDVDKPRNLAKSVTVE